MKNTKENTKETTYAILKPNEIKTVGLVAEAVRKAEKKGDEIAQECEKINAPKVNKILTAHKKDHIPAALEIYKAARESYEGKWQTLKNWVWEWRQLNDLHAKPEGTDTGGNKNTGGDEAISTLKSEMDGDWANSDAVIVTLPMAYAKQVEATNAEHGEYTDGQEQEDVLLIGEKSALAFSRKCRAKRLELKAKREKLSSKDKKEIDDTLKNVNKTATGKRNTQKVSA